MKVARCCPTTTIEDFLIVQGLGEPVPLSQALGRTAFAANGMLPPMSSASYSSFNVSSFHD
jgi:hypothetical protein